MSASAPTTALADRIAAFLGEHPPFTYLKRKELNFLAQRVTVRYVPPHTTIFAQDKLPTGEFYVVHRGAVRLYRNDDNAQLVDKCDEGDIFGLRPLLAKQPYSVSARASEESLLYCVPLAAFEPVIDANNRVARFLATSFAGGVRNPERPNPTGVLVDRETKRPSASPLTSGIADLTRVPVTRNAVVCTPTTSIREAARIMTGEAVGSIVVVNADGLPLGLVTDRDIRQRVVVDGVESSAEVARIMRGRVATTAPDRRVAEVQLEMVRKRTNYLVATLDGTPDTRVVGIISNRDILLALGSSPAAVVREVETANDAAELKRLRERSESWLRGVVDRRGSVYTAASVMTEINDAVTRRALELAAEQLASTDVLPADASYCWLALGSHGRGEQMLRTDQDHAVVFADVSAGELDATRAYYVQLASATSAILSTVGYDECVGDMMANNPAWCLSLSEWEAQLDDWVAEPNGAKLLNASTLMDRRPIAGDLALGERLRTWTAQRIKGERLLLAFMAKAAIDNPPPLSFFRSVVVEKSGDHKDDFDIKQRAMLPLADAARVLCLEQGIADPPNTIDRFDRLRRAEPQNEELYQAAAEAYDTLMLFRARQGLSDGGEGRFFKINKIGKLGRLQLRNTFGPIEELQGVLRLRFQVNMLTK